jgi:branched-chain amino acid transport system substrate-binding protein
MRVPRHLGLFFAAVAVGVAITTMQAAASTKATCDNSSPIKIGVSYSLTGPLAGIGKLASQGAAMAVRDLNASGGIMGKCVQEDLQDDQGTATGGAQVIRLLVDQDKVAYVVGPFGSSVTQVEIPITTQAKVIEVDESSLAASGDPNNYPYVFRAETNTTQQAQALVPFLKANHWSSVAIEAVNTAFGTVFISTLQSLLPAAGITITGTSLVNSGTVDVTPQLSQLKSGNPQLLIAGISADPDQIALINGLKSLGWKVPVIGTNAMANPGTTNAFSADQMAGVYAGPSYKTLTYKSGGGKPTAKLAKQFVAEFAKFLHAHSLKESISQAAGAYDSVMLVANAMNKTKSTDSDTIKSYLESHWYLGVRGIYQYTAQRHDGVTPGDVAYVLAHGRDGYGIVQLAPGQ